MFSNTIWNVKEFFAAIADYAFDYLNENFEGIATGLVLVIIPATVWLGYGYLNDWQL